MLYHMAHMTRISQGIPPFNPLREKSPELKANMSDALWQVLAGSNSYSPITREAWLSHGRVKQSGFGFDNPDLNTYAPLLQSSDYKLFEARSLGCAIRNSPTLAELQNLTRRACSRLKAHKFVRI